MAYATVPHNRDIPQSSSTSPGHVQVTDSQAPSTEKKHDFFIGGIKSWLTKKKDEFTMRSFLSGSRSQHSSGRLNDQSGSMHDRPRRHSSTDFLECVDQIEKDNHVATSQVGLESG